jgi:hypothetical protein
MMIKIPECSFEEWAISNINLYTGYYESAMNIIPDMEDAMYWKGKAQALEEALEKYNEKEVMDRPAGM